MLELVLGGVLEASWSYLGRFLGGQDAPKTSQDGAKMGQDGAKTGQDGAKTAKNVPKTPQDGAKTAQDGAKTAQDGAMTPLVGAKTPNMWRQGASSRRHDAPRWRHNKPNKRQDRPRCRKHTPSCSKMVPKWPEKVKTRRKLPQDVQHGTARAATERAQRAIAADVDRFSKVCFEVSRLSSNYGGITGLFGRLRYFQVHPLRSAVQGISRLASNAQGLDKTCQAL